MATTLSFSFPVFQSTPLSRRVSISCHSSNSNNETLRVAFAGGGTGSNVYPAVAIAEELKTANPTCQFLFLCTPDSVESAAISSAGYDFASVSSPPQNLLFFPHRLFKSLIQCLCHLRHFQPDVVVGTGGYVSFPACLAAKLRGTNVVIHEPNSVPGFANSLLSFFADAIFVAFNSTLDSFPRNKCFVCGNPVRLSIRNLVSKVTAMSHFFPGSDSGSRILLVLAGSFGANAVNIAMLNLYYQMLRQDSGLYVIWQTGVEAFDEMDSLVKTHPRLYITPFMHCMGLAYAAADLIVSRAGAMTCYEILATGKPSILIPSPNFSEGNQFRNASLMADLAGVTVITEDELDSSTLAIAIEKILRDKKKMEDMSERALKAANPNASAEIAKHILSLVNLSTKEKRNTATK
ncbi:UDP-N-acetylglucosamine--N-acetylmuramyl-(pentapeptide) pyrophosphoryl-undecaprenol N-acetylglucosamine transferase [Glycine max]|nr:UDP-N-acetylglucosamine--N-acetylmuramyl-(pentapeptide) pyrophosphoryl-undecaprenol N-acetylglucosamine transferase [Glycine max]